MENLPKVVGFIYRTPDGDIIILPSKINNLFRLVSKDEFDKNCKSLMNKYMVHLCTKDINDKMVHLYYVKHKEVKNVH